MGLKERAEVGRPEVGVVAREEGEEEEEQTRIEAERLNPDMRRGDGLIWKEDKKGKIDTFFLIEDKG